MLLLILRKRRQHLVYDSHSGVVLIPVLLLQTTALPLCPTSSALCSLSLFPYWIHVKNKNPVVSFSNKDCTLCPSVSKHHRIKDGFPCPISYESPTWTPCTIDFSVSGVESTTYMRICWFKGKCFSSFHGGFSNLYRASSKEYMHKSYLRANSNILYYTPDFPFKNSRK